MLELSRTPSTKLIEKENFWTGNVQSISEVQDGFVKAPESVFGEPHPTRRRVKSAHRIVVKVGIIRGLYMRHCHALLGIVVHHNICSFCFHGEAHIIFRAAPMSVLWQERLTFSLLRHLVHMGRT